MQRRIAPQGKTELLGLLSALPLCVTRIRGSIDPVVTCSDASLLGLGVSRSIGLTDEWWRLFEHGYFQVQSTWTPLSFAVPENREPKIFCIGLFDGIGGVRRSVERLRGRVMLSVSVEQNARASQVV